MDAIVDGPLARRAGRIVSIVTGARRRADSIRSRETAVSIDRLPPQSIEAEQSVLGALLIDRDAVIEVAELLRPEDFYRADHGTIYAAILALYERREPVDIVTVSEVLERDGQLEQVGGSAYLTSLINLTPTAVNAVYYARIVERKAVLRNLIARRGPHRRHRLRRRRGPRRIHRPGRAGAVRGQPEARRERLRAPQQPAPLRATTGSTTCTSTRARSAASAPGFADLDAMTTGLQKSDLIIVAARPSIGKTSLALNFAEHAAVREGKTVGIFSLEMSKEQLVLRLLSSVANIDSQRLRTGFLEEMDFTRLAPAMNALAEAPDLHRRHAQHQHHGAAHQGASAPGRVRPGPAHRGLPPADAVDASSRATPTGSRRSRRSRAASRRWRASCRCRSSRSASSHARRRCANREEPRLSDLRESGSIEQDSDLVMFLWREKERGAEDQDADGEIINLRLAKHRNGPTGETKLWFRKRQTRFVSYAEEERYARRTPRTRADGVRRPADGAAGSTVSSGSSGRSVSVYADAVGRQRRRWPETPPDGTVVTCAACSGVRPPMRTSSWSAVRREVGERQVRPRPGDAPRGRVVRR